MLVQTGHSSEQGQGGSRGHLRGEEKARRGEHCNDDGGGSRAL